MDPLKQLDIDLENTQRQTLLEILDYQYEKGIIKSEDEYHKKLADLTAKLKKNEPMMQVRKQSGQTNPDDFNQTLQELNIDLFTIFEQINKMDETVAKHQQLSQSVINDIKLRIKKLHDDMDRYEILALSGSSDGVIIEPFRDGNSFEPLQSYYTDQNNLPVAEGYRARLDVYKEAISLPPVINENVITGPGGMKLAEVTIDQQLGSGLIRLANPEHALDKAVDSSYDTFWGETILTDTPLEVYVDKLIQNGAFCKLKLSFNSPTQLNQLTLIPFSDYPLDVVRITGVMDGEEFDIIAPAGLNDIYIDSTTDPMTFQFHSVLVKELYIWLNQRHYVRTNYVANESVAETMALWLQARQATPDIPEGVFAPMYMDMAEKDPAWVFFSKAAKESWGFFNENIKKMSSANFNKLFKHRSQITRSVTKYQYSYGLYNIGAFRNEYQNFAVYVSRPMSVLGNTKSVSIEVNEELPRLVELPGVAPTNVEYYITSDDGKTWNSILPKGVTSINGELLHPVLTGSVFNAKPRFPIKADTTFTVRKNGVAITSGTDYTWDGVNITFTNYDATSNYTITYAPDANPEFDFMSRVHPQRTGEEFAGTTAQAELTLKYFPYLNKDTLYKTLFSTGARPVALGLLSEPLIPIRVQLITNEGQIIDQKTYSADTGIFIENVTDYLNPDNNMLQSYIEDVQNYQYRVVGNKIQFNKVIPKTWKIVVEYSYLVGEVRLKAILRRTLKEHSELTPIINNYRINFKSLL